jgi:hypothetical protein
MSNNNPLRESFRKPSPKYFIVVNSDGKPMGRMTLSASFAPVAPQFASCYTIEEASLVAQQIGGKAAPMPIFDDQTQSWIIPSIDTSISQ